MPIHYPPILPNSLTTHLKRIHPTMYSSRMPSIIRIPYPFLTSLLSFSPEKDVDENPESSLGKSQEPWITIPEFT